MREKAVLHGRGHCSSFSACFWKHNCKSFSESIFDARTSWTATRSAPCTWRKIRLMLNNWGQTPVLTYTQPRRGWLMNNNLSEARAQIVFSGTTPVYPGARSCQSLSLHRLSVVYMWKNQQKGVCFLFYCYLCRVLSEIIVFLFSTQNCVIFLTWAHSEQLCVAQNVIYFYML